MAFISSMEHLLSMPTASYLEHHAVSDSATRLALILRLRWQTGAFCRMIFAASPALVERLAKKSPC